MSKFDNEDICPKCGGKNKASDEQFEQGYLATCSTKCTICNHSDEWAYGYYRSLAVKDFEGFNNE